MISPCLAEYFCEMTRCVDSGLIILLRTGFRFNTSLFTCESVNIVLFHCFSVILI